MAESHLEKRIERLRKKRNLLQPWFHLLLKRAGLPPIRFHDLRHTAATLFMVVDVHSKVVQELLGHSQSLVTWDTYSHMLPPLQEEAVSRLHALLTAPLFPRWELSMTFKSRRQGESRSSVDQIPRTLFSGSTVVVHYCDDCA